MKSAALFLPGLLFGVGLAISGMANPAKVIGFLDVAGKWDPTLLCVMGAAVCTFALLNVLIHKRAAPILGGTFPGVRGSSGVDLRLAVGALLFGAGWGLGGICPGPAIIDLAHLRGDVFGFVAAMAVGMVIAQRAFGADAPAEPPEPPQGEPAG
jgi:uncharacterized membrane protein YedE/YeeE